MRIRLFYCGMRAINFLADITNYIMLEMGQPMHAFDSRKVEKIRIKRFEKPFEFKTLDGGSDPLFSTSIIHKALLKNRNNKGITEQGRKLSVS